MVEIDEVPAQMESDHALKSPMRNGPCIAAMEDEEAEVEDPIKAEVMMDINKSLKETQ